MHLHLTLPESLAQHPAFSSSPFAAGYVAAGSEPVEEASTSAAAEDDDEGSSTAATIFNVGILLLIPLGMYFLLIRPNKKRRQAAQELQSSIGVGDEVLLTSGVYGFITAMDEGSDVVWVEIDDDVQVRVTRAAISGKVSTSATAAAATSEDTPDDDADADADVIEADGSADAAAAAPTKRVGSKPVKPSKAAPARPSLKGTSTGTPANSPESAEPGDE